MKIKKSIAKHRSGKNNIRQMSQYTQFYSFTFFCISAKNKNVGSCDEWGFLISVALNIAIFLYLSLLPHFSSRCLHLSTPTFITHTTRMVYEVINYFVIRISLSISHTTSSQPFIFIIRNEINPMRQRTHIPKIEKKKSVINISRRLHMHKMK